MCVFEKVIYVLKINFLGGMMYITLFNIISLVFMNLFLLNITTDKFIKGERMMTMMMCRLFDIYL